MNRITLGQVVVAVLAAAVIAVLPPLVLGISLLWLITPVLGLLGAAGILLLNKPMLASTAVLLFLMVGAGQVLSPMRLSTRQQRANHAMGHFLTGEVFSLKGDYYKAFQAYNSSLEKGLEHPWVDYRIAQCHTNLGSPGDQEKAFLILSRLKDKPESIPLWVTLPDYGIVSFKAGQFEQSRQAFYQALEYNLNPGNIYYQLGIFYLRRGDADSAWANFTKAHRLGQYRSDCSVKLGRIAEARGEHIQAEELYRRAISENVENLSAYTKLGLLLAGRNRHAEAEELMKQGLELLTWKKFMNPAQAAEFIIAFGDLYVYQGRLGNASMLYKMAIKNNPNWMEGYLKLADVYVGTGQIPAAVSVLQAALQVNPGYTEARRMLEKLTAPEPDTSSSR